MFAILPKRRRIFKADDSVLDLYSFLPLIQDVLGSRQIIDQLWRRRLAILEESPDDMRNRSFAEIAMMELYADHPTVDSVVPPTLLD